MTLESLAFNLLLTRGFSVWVLVFVAYYPSVEAFKGGLTNCPAPGRLDH